MKPCAICGTGFYCIPCQDTGGSLLEKKYCSRKCSYAGRKLTPDTAPERFWSYVDKDGPGGCWLWTGTKHFRGYGACTKSYGDTRAHRVAWLLTYGERPKLYVLHRCNVMLCVNPDHLYLGDQKQNMADCIAAGRRNHAYMPLEKLLHPQLSRKQVAR